MSTTAKTPAPAALEKPSGSGPVHHSVSVSGSNAGVRSVTALPTSLVTRTPAEGLVLANLFVDALTREFPADDSMPGMLRTAAAARPSREFVSAIYFHAIAVANRGWV